MKTKINMRRKSIENIRKKKDDENKKINVIKNLLKNQK